MKMAQGKIDIIEQKQKEGWIYKWRDYGNGGREWYLEKDNYRVAVSRYGRGYGEPSIKDIELYFKAISLYESNSDLVKSVRNNYDQYICYVNRLEFLIYCLIDDNEHEFDIDAINEEDTGDIER